MPVATNVNFQSALLTLSFFIVINKSREKGEHNNALSARNIEPLVSKLLNIKVTFFININLEEILYYERFSIFM